MRKIKIELLLCIFLCVGFTPAFATLSGSLTNDINTLTINANFWCGYSPSNAAPPTGNYTLTMNWTDGTGSAASYQTPLASPDALVLGSGSNVTITCLNNPNFPTEANEGYNFSIVNDLTIILTSASNPLLTWSLEFNNGNWVMPVNGTLGFNANSPSCGVVPIMLVSFSAQKVAPSSVYLSWLTNSEYDMSRYEIERSNDGNTFATINTVPSINSSSSYTYTYTDDIPAAAKQYYRLKMVKIYGSFEYSYIRMVQGLTPQPQPTPPPPPPAVPCNLSLTSLVDSSCTKPVTKLILSNIPSNIPSWSSLTWTSTPFYPASTPGYRFVSQYLNAYVGLTNANVVTVTANVSGCSTGGTIVKTIFKGTPAVKTTTSYRYTTDPCSGVITSSTATVNVTAFPGTSASQYLWYINNNYSSTGLSRSFNTFNNTSTINYQVRFVGPCGTSLASGSFGGSTPPPIDPSFTISPNPAVNELTIVSNKPAPLPCDPPPTYKSNVSNVKLIDGYEIIDYSGNVVKRQIFNSAMQSVKVNTVGIKKGNYRLKIYADKTFTTQQIVLVN
jgi:hypothetical protein